MADCRATLRKVALTAALAASAMAAPAQAKVFVVSPAILPLTYRYAACAFAQEEATVEAQIASCRPLRDELEASLDTILSDYHRRNGLFVRRQTMRGFRQIDAEAAEAWEEGKTVPKVILTYLDCLGTRQMESDTYSSGNSLDWITIEPECRKVPVEGEVFMTRAAIDRAKMLFQRFRVRGRAVKVSGSEWQNMEFRYGFLGLDRLPADGDPEYDKSTES